MDAGAIRPIGRTASFPPQGTRYVSRTARPANLLSTPTFDEAVAGLVLEQGFAGTIRLERSLSVWRVFMAPIRWSVQRRQRSPLTIAGSAHHCRRNLQHACRHHECANDSIFGAPAIVRLATNGKLNITGDDGMPLTGSGTLDTTDESPQQCRIDGRNFRRPVGVRPDGRHASRDRE